MFRRLVAAAVIAASSAGAVLVAQDADREQAEAMSRRAADRLEALHDEADRLALEERTLLGEVRRLEIDRDIRTTELTRVRADVRAASSTLAALDRQVTTLSAESEAALPDLQARLVTLYKLGRGQYARLLLSASDLRQLGQAVRLVSALAEQDRERVRQFQQRLIDLSTARTAAAERKAQLQQLQVSSQNAERAAQRAVDAHAARIREIDSRRDLNAQYASDLLTAQQRLEASLSGTVSTGAALPIAPFKGTLDWPTEGTLRHRFGSSSADRPPLRGIEIEATAGTAVRAVHEGAVVHAEPFAGYGRLVIVDHGNQAFTLYGNLDDITVSKGEHVSRGDTVGTVGSADGVAALYFELRVDGRTVDPLQWLAKR